MPFQLSPGVAVVEKDFSSIIPAVSASTGAFAGSFPWGPVLSPITVSSENQLVKQFGFPNDSNFQSFFTAANFLAYSNNLLLVRADSASAKNAVHIQSGSVSTISVGTAGSGYISTATPPAVTISAPDESGGIQATATTVISGGGVTAISVGSSGGSGYTGTPTVTITPAAGDTGSGATATVTLSGGAIASFTITAPGSGYKKTPTVTVSGTGTGFTVGSVTLATSSVTGINIVTAGTGYAQAPTITIAAPPSGTTALATSTITTAGVKINNGQDYLNNYSTGAGVVGEFAAKYPGALGNGLLISYADSTTYSTWAYKGQFNSAPGTSAYAASVGGSLDELHVVIVDSTGVWTGTPGTILEKFGYVSKAADAMNSTGVNNHYKNVINSSSNYIWWMDYPSGNWGAYASGVTFAAAPSAAATGYTLSGGISDYNLTDSYQQAAYALFTNAELYDISLLMAGAADSTTANYICGIADSRKDCVAFISPQDVSAGGPIVGNTSTQTTSIVAYRNAVNYSGSYAVMDSGYKYQYDRYNDKYRYVPLNGDIAGLCARTDQTNDAWWSPGGYTRGQIKNVVRLAYNPDSTNRDTLYQANINPVVSFPGNGVVLYGDKTMQTKPSAFDRINVRRLFIVLEKAIAIAAKYQLFEFNDSFTQAQFTNMVQPFLRDVQGRRGITDFVVVCNSSNNTAQVVDSNQFVADIYIKPARSINFIQLNFIAASTSANFTEIGG